MGSKSSKNKSTSTNASQMAALQKANPAPTMEEAMGNQQSMQSSLMEQIMPAFSAMMQMGQEQMGSNPNMPKFAGQLSDREMTTLQDMIASMQPQEPQPQQPQQAQQMPPVSPFMRGQYMVDQGMANGGQTAPSSASLYEQMMGNPYAGINRDV